MRFFLLLLFSIFFFACSSDSEGIIIDGILEVPENRDNPNSRTLNLEYKILKAKDTTSRKNPIVYLQGGPGGATIVMEGFWKNHSLRNDRDIILMDQRGTGKSEANCTDIGKAMMTILRKDLNSHQEIKLQDSILSICKENMKRKRIDLAGYNSRENAADFEDLRKILGYEKWNLWGVSYGTRLGLTIMRDYPKRIRSAVLAGILAPETAHLNNSIIDFEHSLFSVLKRCEENESCNERYPNLKERLLKTFKNIKSQPLRFNYKGIPFTLNYQDALLVLYLPLYDSQTIANIPLIIEALENGQSEHITNALQQIESLYDLLNWSMNYSVMIYDELAFYDLAAMKKSLEQSVLMNDEPELVKAGFELFSNWHSFRASEIENQPVVSDIPTLMVSGGLDHVTPVRNANESLKHLKNGHGVLFPDEAHNLYNPCFFEIAEDFLNNPTQKPDSECSTEKNPIEWNLSNPI